MWLGGGGHFIINPLINKLHEQVMIHCNLCQTGSPYIHTQNHRYAILFCMEKLYIVIRQYRKMSQMSVVP
jgi:hypothetical protein